METIASKTEKRTHTNSMNPTDTQHTAHNLTSAQRKSPPLTLQPTQVAQAHAAYPLLLNYAKNGCPVDCGPPWSQEHITAAVERGNHPSACTSEAIACLRAETMEKVEAGLAKLVL